MSFTSEELLLFLAIGAIVGGIMLSNYFKGFREFWSPLTVIAAIYTYYCVLGPWEALASGKTYDRLLNMRGFYLAALTGGLLILISIWVGFHTHRSKVYPVVNRHPDSMLFYYGIRVCILGFVLFSVSAGGNILGSINPLEAEQIETTAGTFGNYFSLGINFFIPGITLLLLHYLRTRRGLVWLLVFLVVAVGLYTTLGFRYRLVLLSGAMVCSFYLYKRIRPNLVLLAPFAFLLVMFMGIIDVGRQYGGGLNLNKIEKGDTGDYYQSGLKESRIFQTSGAVISKVPESYPHVGFQPLISAVLFPIPKAFYPQKNSAAYIVDIMKFVYGPRYFMGSAFLNYAEYYLAFGWAGIIIGGFLIGWFTKKLWNWYLSDPDNPFVIAAYSLTVVYLYVVISRGYLPQVVMLFFFSAFPIYVVLWLARRSRPTVLKRNVPRVAN